MPSTSSTQNDLPTTASSPTVITADRRPVRNSQRVAWRRRPLSSVFDEPRLSGPALSEARQSRLRSLIFALACVVAVLAACVVACDGRRREDKPISPSPPTSQPESRPTQSTLGAPTSPTKPNAYSTPEPKPWKAHVAEINFAGGLSEAGRSRIFGSSGKRSFADLVGLLTGIERGREPLVKGVLLVLGGAHVELSAAEEIGRILARVRASGVPVVCHADNLGNGSYWLSAAACNHIVLSPGGGVDTVGIAAQTLYAGRLLSDLRVDVNVLQVGDYKGASEPYTRDGPSDEARSTLIQTLSSIRTLWLDGVGAARVVARERVEDGPYSANDARRLGLVDAIGFVDEARDTSMTMASVTQTVPRFGPGARDSDASGAVGIIRLLSGAGLPFDRPIVAVVRASGAITMGSGGSLFSDGDGISEQALTRTLTRLGKDDSVRAVVLRINSPGGSALASDLLWKQVRQLRDKKPVVVSIGGMAASGGYYIASAGTRLFAESTSIVGSIGVVGGKLSVARTLDRFGVTAETFAASDVPGAEARAAYMSPFAAWDDATQERVNGIMKSVYDLFLERVAEGRSMPLDKVAAFADGRIFAARDGVVMGMVDEIGGLQDAIDSALLAAGLGLDGGVRLIDESGGLEKLLGIDSDGDVASAESGPLSEQLLRSFATHLAAHAAPNEIIPFIESWFPIARGERTLVAVPFALLVR